MDKHEAKALALMQQAQYHQYQKELEEYKGKLRKARSERTQWKNKYLRLITQTENSTSTQIVSKDTKTHIKNLKGIARNMPTDTCNDWLTSINFAIAQLKSGQNKVDIEPLINDIKSGKYYHETDNGGYNMEPMEIVNIIVSKIRDYFHTEQ